MRAAEQLHDQLARFGLGWITLEEPIANVSWAGTSKRGRPFLGMRDTQRADIAIWSRSDIIYGLVEMKGLPHRRRLHLAGSSWRVAVTMGFPQFVAVRRIRREIALSASSLPGVHLVFAAKVC